MLFKGPIRKIILVHAVESTNFRRPITQKTLQNLRKAMSYLEDKACQNVFVSLEHFSTDMKKLEACDHIMKDVFSEEFSLRARNSALASRSGNSSARSFVIHAMHFPQKKIVVKLFSCSGRERIIDSIKNAMEELKLHYKDNLVMPEIAFLPE